MVDWLIDVPPRAQASCRRSSCTSSCWARCRTRTSSASCASSPSCRWPSSARWRPRPGPPRTRPTPRSACWRPRSRASCTGRTGSRPRWPRPPCAPPVVNPRVTLTAAAGLCTRQPLALLDGALEALARRRFSCSGACCSERKRTLSLPRERQRPRFVAQDLCRSRRAHRRCAACLCAWAPTCSERDSAGGRRQKEGVFSSMKKLQP